jgi:hypothetical protein
MAKKFNVCKFNGTGRPGAIELFTTSLSHLTAAQAITYPPLELNYSPAPQITAPNGDLIAPQNANSQANSDIPAGFIHQQAPTRGEKRKCRFARPWRT